MLFWTVLAFVIYSLIYFIVSQRKIRRLQSSNVKLNMTLNEKNHVMQNSMRIKDQYNKHFSN